MFINTIIDEINLKNMPEVITDFFRKNGEKKFNNLRNFYDNLLKYVSEDIRDSYLNRILKYLSSSSSNLLQDFSKYLVDEINKYDNYKDLYESLNRKVNYIFYDKDDYLNIKESHNKEDYKTFIFLLLKHTFKTYQINIPGIVSTRLYEESITMVYDSETRKRMMSASANLGNIDASVLHACHLLKEHNLEISLLSYSLSSGCFIKYIDRFVIALTFPNFIASFKNFFPIIIVSSGDSLNIMNFPIKSLPILFIDFEKWNFLYK